MPSKPLSPFGWIVRIAAIAAAVFLAAKLSQHLTTPPSNASPVWPGAGIALAVALHYGPRGLIGVFLGAVAFEFQLFALGEGARSLETQWLLAAGLGIGAAAQGLVGAELIRRFGGSLPRLVRDGDILRFQLLGGPVACLVSASIGMATLWSLGFVATADLPVSWLTWWVGDTIGALIFAPLVLIFLGPRRSPLGGRRTTVALPMLALLLAAVAFYSYASIKEAEQRRLRFAQQVHGYQDILRREFQTHLALLDSLQRFFDAGRELSAEQFRIFTRPAVARHPGIHALEWIPRVTREQRPTFERSLPGAGPIRRLGPDGVLVEASERAEYYAIQYVEPPETNALAFGYDVTGNPLAVEALYRARDTGRATATRALRLVQETADEVGIVVYNPVYAAAAVPVDAAQRRASIVGVVAAVFRMRSLIVNSMPSFDDGMIALRLLDVSDGGESKVLYTSHDADALELAGRMVERFSFDVAERRWTLEYTATPEYEAANTTWAVWVVLTGGLVITALLGTGLLLLTGRTLRTEDAVISRTAELRDEVSQRRDAETRLRLVLDGAKLGFWDWDYTTGRQWVNDRWLEILGLERSDLNNEVGDWLERVHAEDRSRVLAVIDQHVRADTGYVVDFRMRHKHGHWVWVQSAGAVVGRDSDSGAAQRLCGIHQDVTERMKQEEHILHQAHFDALTDLPNRFLALDRLAQLLNEARRDGERVAVLFLDLDDFKKINDTLGHDTGDKLLKQAAFRLQSAVRGGDTVGRLGGDEFIVLLGGLKGAADARPVAETLLGKFAQPFSIDSRELILSVSIGISVFPDDGDTPSELLRSSDSAMYHSKEQGRNTYSYFTDQMNTEVSRRLLLEEQMHGALLRGEFRLSYQPKVELAGGAIVGFEALLRWRNPDLGDVSPLEFIPIAEQSGLIVPIGKFVLAEALTKASAWRKQWGCPCAMAVNLSPRQFRDPDLVAYVGAALEQAGAPPGLLELEITEGVLMSGHGSIADALEALSALGVAIAMDDFGTGYSSLSYLRSYPFDVLKIDREFVSDLPHDSADRELVSAAIAMARGLGLKVVAEGIETQAQLEFLTAQGCDYGQGYLFGKPVSAEEVEALLQDGKSRIRAAADA